MSQRDFSTVAHNQPLGELEVMLGSNGGPVGRKPPDALRRDGRGTADSARYSLTRNAHARMRQSLEAGYYLEAIALQDSLICDRLESLIATSKMKLRWPRWATL